MLIDRFVKNMQNSIVTKYKDKKTRSYKTIFKIR